MTPPLPFAADLPPRPCAIPSCDQPAALPDGRHRGGLCHQHQAIVDEIVVRSAQRLRADGAELSRREADELRRRELAGAA
jgi:hypothetical protein